MTRLTCLPTLAAIIFIISPGDSQGDETTPLQDNLAQIYGRWRSAMTTGNFERWRETTASYRQVITRNAIVSRKELFPSTLFKVAINPPDLKDLRLIKFEKTDNTAVCVYYGKVDFSLGIEEIPENLLVLRFLFEDDAWRYDNSRFINLTGAEFVRENIAKGDLKFLEDEDFAPLDSAPPVGSLCPVPDFAAHIHIVSVGYRTKASVNDIHQIDVSQDGGTEIITGGLQTGENTIKFEIETLDLPDDATSGRQFEVSIYALRRQENKPPVRVYHFAPTDPAKLPASVEKTFTVDPHSFPPD